MVFGGQNDSQNRFFAFLWGCFFAPSFYTDFLLISGVFFDARNLKNRVPVEARAQFLIFRMFDVRSKSASKTAPKKHGF